MKNIRKTPLAAAVALATSMIVAGCGGSSSGGDDDGPIAGDPVVSRGVITGFGSVYVHGRRYQTGNTRFEVDDDNGSESELRVGMLVTVRGYYDDDGYHADEIEYDNEIKGPVTDISIDPGDATRKTLTILGQAVLVTAATTIDDDGNLTFDTIAVGDVLEVSGYVGDAQLVATHIELQDDDDEIEIKGMIENLGPNSFEIRGFPITYDSDTEIDDDIDELVEGLYVEVEGQLNAVGDTLIAEEIESEEDDSFDDVDEIEIVGAISEYDDDDKTFMLQGQRVDASTAELEPASLNLVDGLIVEVEGYIVDGVLIADEVELEDDYS